MDIEKLLELVKSGEIPISEATKQISSQFTQPQEVDHLGFAQVDLDRERRTGFPEVVFGEGKTAEQIIAIFQSLYNQTNVVLATRVDQDKAEKVKNVLTDVIYHSTAKA